jgi:hypothetical protein
MDENFDDTCVFDKDETAFYTFQKPQKILARKVKPVEVCRM